LITAETYHNSGKGSAEELEDGDTGKIIIGSVFAPVPIAIAVFFRSVPSPLHDGNECKKGKTFGRKMAIIVNPV